MSKKRPPFETLFVPGKKKKAEGGGVGGWGVGGGGEDHNRHFVYGQNGGVLLTLQRFNESRWRPSTEFLSKTLDNGSSSRRGAGMVAPSHCGQYFEGV